MPVSNIRLVYYIKKNIGVGSVILAPNNTVVYRLANNSILAQHLIPIFEIFPLLTTTHYSYVQFRETLFAYLDTSLTGPEKDNIIIFHYSTTMPLDYVSPSWPTLGNCTSCLVAVNIIMSKY